jgi:MYXO-CTERM domain-containing protein
VKTLRAVLVSAIFLPLSTAAVPTARPQEEDVDASGSLRGCGLRCLYLLFLMSGKQVPQSPRWHSSAENAEHLVSMSELQSIARESGMTLRGEVLSVDEAQPDRPMIAYLEYPGGGHFVVVRPVGRTGTMVQVLDPNREPFILDHKHLSSLPGWTGRVLVPRGPSEISKPLWAMVLLGLGMLAAWRYHGRFPRRRLATIR